MRLKDDCTVTEDLQAGRAWTAAGWKIADLIDREMNDDEGLATLQRAADLMTLAELPQGYELRMWFGPGKELQVRIVDRHSSDFTPYPQLLFARSGPDAIAKAAAWAKQEVLRRGLFVADADAHDADATSISAAAASLPRADKPGGGE
jgi:hypothetical protein